MIWSTAGSSARAGSIARERRINGRTRIKYPLNWYYVREGRENAKICDSPRNARLHFDAHTLCGNRPVHAVATLQYQLTPLHALADADTAQYILVIEELQPAICDPVLVLPKTLQMKCDDCMLCQHIPAAGIHLRCLVEGVYRDPRPGGSVQSNRQNLRVMERGPTPEPGNHLGRTWYIGRVKHIHSIIPEAECHRGSVLVW